MDRRTLLKLLAYGSTMLPYTLAAKAEPKAPLPNYLVLIELNGGNDGLNTVIPFNDPRYYTARPTIAIQKKEVLPLNDQLGLHPSMNAMKRLYDQHELAIVQGVGYPRPNRSHFRSIEIWDTASSSDEYLDHGWIHDIALLERFRTKGVVLGGELGPLEGMTSGVIKVDRLKQFLNQSKNIPSHVTYLNDNSALLHLLKTEAEITRSATLLRERLKSIPLAHPYAHTQFGRELDIATRIIDSTLPIPVLKIRLGSFDTHFNQPYKHAVLLKELSDGLATLRDNLMASGQWKNTLVVTYSEFGRRVAENASKGTDHGTAAPHFVTGGKVKGGIYGPMPSLENLDRNGDLIYTTDFRSLYHTIEKEWFYSASPRLEAFPLLPFIKHNSPNTKGQMPWNLR